MLHLKSIVLASLVAAVSAHQNLHEFFVNDVSPGFEVGIRRAPSNSPVTALDTNDIVCNVGGTSGAGVKTIEAKAGDKITVQWDQSGHPGPITHMLHGPVLSAEAASGVGEWFKIDEVNNVGGKWANEIMGADGMKHTFTIPAGVATGEYLLRSEMLALHASQNIGGAQFYIGCMQLKITGSSTAATCGPKITLPGAYKPTDASIYIPNVYNGFDVTTYKAPGGPVASCGAGSGSSPAPAPAVSSKPTASSSLPSETAIPSSTTTSSPTTPAEEYPSETATIPSQTSAVATSNPTIPVEEYPSETIAPLPSPTEQPSEENTTPIPTPSATQPSTGEESPAPIETNTPAPSEPSPAPESPAPAPGATELPANTKLSSVLSWLSKFYAAHGTEFDSETPLRRRHARQF